LNYVRTLNLKFKQFRKKTKIIFDIMDSSIIIHISSSHQAHTIWGVSIKTIIWSPFVFLFSHISSLHHTSSFKILEVQWVLQILVQLMEQPMILLVQLDLLDEDQM